MIGFYYDGTRWLSDDVYDVGSGGGAVLSATTGNGVVVTADYLGCSDIYILNVKAVIDVAAGGTALGASHHWDSHWDVFTTTTPAGVTVATNVLNAGANGFREVVTPINALLSSLITGSTGVLFRSNFVKTGTPGNLTAWTMSMTYRLVTT